MQPRDQLTEKCGQCTLCLDQCPTQAIESPYSVNASKCISYHTIENTGEIPLDIVNKLSDWAFGCDICQEVCPFNKPTSVSRKINPDPDLSPTCDTINVPYLLSLGSGEHKRLVKKRALKRTSRTSMIKNAANLILAKGNQLSEETKKHLLSQLDQARCGTNPHARAAIKRAKVRLKVEKKTRRIG